MLQYVMPEEVLPISSVLKNKTTAIIEIRIDIWKLLGFWGVAPGARRF